MEIEAAQLVNGSGEVLIRARLPALVACVPAATPPPTMPAASKRGVFTSPTALAAKIAPAGMQINV